MNCLRKVSGLSASLLAISLFFGQHPAARAEFDCNTVSEIPVSECGALVSIYTSTNGGSWANNESWLISNTPCSWHGVSCSGGHVTWLDLKDNQITGSIPSELGNLAYLEELYLWSNLLTGSIPAEFGQLTLLENLNLRNNQLSGPIPAEIGNAVSLKWLSLNNNKLSGPVPMSLLNLSELVDHESNFCNNYLWTYLESLRDFLNLKQNGGNWENCQISPKNVDCDQDVDVDGYDLYCFIEDYTDQSIEAFSLWFGGIYAQ